MSTIKNNTTELYNILNAINNLPEAEGGVTLPELTNEGTAADLMATKELIDGEGNKITGTFTIDNELSTQDNLISQIQTALEGKATATPKLQEKTATPTTSSQTITPDSNYDGLSKVTVNAMPTATQTTPSISVSSSGLITASATQSAGYVASGTKSATKQLTVQAAKTVTPTTSNQTAVASGRYTTGAITVKGDANLKAENIAEGVSIFGITGTHSGGGSGGGSSDGGSSVETCTVTVIQAWGMGDDPDLLHCYIPYYNILADGSVETGFEYFSSVEDFEPQHSITFKAYKNVPINVYAYSSSAGEIRFTTSANGGDIFHHHSTGSGGGLFSLVPTSDTATFTFSSL